LAAIIREGGNHHKKRANEIALRHAETRLKYSTKYLKKKKSQFVTSNFYLNLRCKREKMKTKKVVQIKQK
jgi:Tfp pilus assembly protein PilX